MPPVNRSKSKITAWLENAPTWVFSTFAVTMAFTTYFCMYSYRKPFAVATYAGQEVWFLDLKSALVISQLLGYALSKLLGIKFNSEMPKSRRALALIVLILWAEAALVLFAVLPPEGKVFAIFLNGLPLGAIWGLVFSFLEGRQVSEILGAGLSCAYIVASGAVKSVGDWLMSSHGISESWMPAMTGLLFFPLILMTIHGLRLLPDPSKEDVEARVDRAPMFKEQRRAFVRRYLFGLLVLVVVYIFLTAYRDFRDNFAAELWTDLGYGGAPEVFTLSELPIAFSVMVVLSLLFLVKNNRWGLLATFVIMAAGSLLIGVSTILFDLGMMSGMTWMVLVGLGLYLGYVPYGCVLFDRMIAALGVVATAVFLIYLTDAAGYGGSVGVVIYKRLGQTDASMLDFFRYFSYATCVATVIGFVVSGAYFMRRAKG
jgi:MFS family permease